MTVSIDKFSGLFPPLLTHTVWIMTRKREMGDGKGGMVEARDGEREREREGGREGGGRERDRVREGRRGGRERERERDE